MKLIFSMCIIIVAWASCTGKSKVPNDILAPHIMQDLVWDVMVAEEYAKDLAMMDTVKTRSHKRNGQKYTSRYSTFTKPTGKIL